jgi:hypothetical protein
MGKGKYTNNHYQFPSNTKRGRGDLILNNASWLFRVQDVYRPAHHLRGKEFKTWG